MTRTDTLGHFLTDVADAIREKKGTSGTITASDFDTEIQSIPTGGGGESTASLVSGTGTSAVWSYDWQNIVIPDTFSIADGLYYKLKRYPDLKFNSNIRSVNNLYRETLITTVDMTNWNISNISDYTECFRGCTMLTSIITPSTQGNASNVLLKNVFWGCTGLTTVDLSGLHIENASYLNYMFRDCSNVTSIDIRNIYGSSNNNLTGMFYNCTKLTHLDIRNLTLKEGINYGGMLNNVPYECEIIVKDSAAKTFMANKFSGHTNVKTVEEYEAE